MRKSIWNIGFVAAAVATGLALSYRPWSVWRDQRIKADQHIEEMRQAEKSREELIRKRARIETPLGKEEIAREQGYLKPGEQPTGGRG
jgi:hypothetical protein